MDNIDSVRPTPSKERPHPVVNDISPLIHLLSCIESSRFARLDAVLTALATSQRETFHKMTTVAGLMISSPLSSMFGAHAREVSKVIEQVTENSALREISRAFKMLENTWQDTESSAHRVPMLPDRYFDSIDSPIDVAGTGSHHCQRCCPSNQSDNSRAESPSRRRKGHLGFDLRY